MEYQKLIYTVEDGIAVIRMNYMKNLNAVDDAMTEELQSALDAAEADPEVRVVVLCGGQKAFSAGGDIGSFYKMVQAGGTIDIAPMITKVGMVADTMKRMSKMIITSVSGAAAGAGASLAFGGDFLICTENAKFILAFANIGLVPDTGATYLLAKSIGTARAMDFAATGRPMGAQEAKELGVAYRVVPAEMLEEETMALAKKLAAGPLVSYKLIKKQMYDAAFSDYRKWLMETEVPTQQAAANTEDFIEGVKAFVEKRRPQFTGK